MVIFGVGCDLHGVGDAANTGTQPVAEGSIEFMGQVIKGHGPWDLVRQGLVMVPEGRGVFARMTITENLHMGAYIRDDDEVQGDIDKEFAIFPRLNERADQLAGTMSGGEQQMLAMGRALMARPKVLLLVEQNASRALGLANRGYVMDSGVITMAGQARALLSDPKVREAYLGE